MFKELYETLSSIVKNGENPFDLGYWTPVYFHPYTSLVEGEWVRRNYSARQSQLDYDNLVTKVGALPSLETFYEFFCEVKGYIIEKGYYVPSTFHKEKHISHSWDNKIAVSLIGKKEEIIILGWADENICIGTKLQKPMYDSDGRSYNICQ